MTSLFSDVEEKKRQPLTDLQADYCIDTSYSTQGAVLTSEKHSAQNMSKYLKQNRIIGWDSTAHYANSFNELDVRGCTEPATFVPLINKSNCLIVYTDGLIGQQSMNELENKVSTALDDIPIIVVFALQYFEISIDIMQSSINMSVPEAFLRLSNNVMILISNGPQHKILMNKGCFSKFESIKLFGDTVLDNLPDFDLENLNEVTVMESLLSHQILLDGFDSPLNLNVLYLSNDVPTEVLESLCNRMHLPRINLDMMHALLVRLNQNMTENPELQVIRDQLSEISVSDKAGTDDHKNLIKSYNLIRSQKNTGGDKKKLRAIADFLAIIADYRANNTSIVLGSNRANRATVFNNNELDYLGTCSQIECNIMMDIGDACVLIKVPDNVEFLKEFTTDYAMESPFEFGTWLANLLTPGIFCYDFAKDMKTNPHTRDNVLGFIPLSENPAVIMKHMSKLFGGNRELWHMVRGYISMMVYACDKEWMDEKVIFPSLKGLISNYNATVDLKGGSEKVPLEQAFANVLKNYSVCLRDRTPNDVRAIMKIVKSLLPEIKFEEEKINGMIDVIDVFLNLLNLHKKNEDMTKYVMEVDDYGHYVRYNTGLQGLISQIFWRDINGDYRKFKLQIAIDTALNHNVFGKSLKKAFTGKEFDDSILEIALDEPTGIHVGEEKYDKWDLNGINELTCTYCGKKFQSTLDKYCHLQQELGQHFYNGHLAVKHAIDELTINSSNKDIFTKAKNLLFCRYGKKAGFLHTQRCKVRLLQFIKKFKKVNELKN
jgi:hypothetical protein